MNNDAGQESLRDVLDGYLGDAERPDSATLTRWIRRYPEYKTELMEFAVTWSIVESLPPAPEEPDSEKEAWRERAHVVIGKVLDQQRAKRRADREAAVLGLLDVGQGIGLSLGQIVDMTRLSAALVRKLDRRLIRCSSIPKEAIDALATALRQDAADIEAYLLGQPLLPQGASYRADQSPTLAEPEDFFHAVRSDPSLSDDERSYWLGLARSEE